MERLIELFRNKLALVPTQLSRSLMSEIQWDAKLIGIKGARGVGKTTLFKALVGQLPIEHGKIRFGSHVEMAYYDQEHESLNYNNCLNRKLGLDKHGFVKNCPSFNTNFGKIESIDLNNLFLNKKFISFWKIKKDDVKICKNCEFRYICSDCRVFTKNNEIDGKPSKCNYDPITNVWIN